MTQTREQLVEVLARAIWPDAFATSTIGQMAAIVKCRNALAALEAAGVRLVPVEFTDDMTDAILDSPSGSNLAYARQAWSELLAASPYAPKELEK